MSQTYYSTITDVGAALISNAPLLGTKVDIVQIAVGDANGTPYRPSPTMTALKHETWRGAVTQYVKESNNIIIVHGVIPASVGGFVIREVAILDDEGNTIAIGNTPDLPKVTVEEGFNFDLELRMRIIVTNAEVIECKMNPHVTIATMADVNLKANKLIPADVGNLACLDETGNLADAGVTWKDISTTMATKATEIGQLILANTRAYPHSNAIGTVALVLPRLSMDYLVSIEVLVTSGSIEGVEVYDKQLNGFKIRYSGSAASATIKYYVSGGMKQ